MRQWDGRTNARSPACVMQSGRDRACLAGRQVVLEFFVPFLFKQKRKGSECDRGLFKRLSAFATHTLNPKKNFIAWAQMKSQPAPSIHFSKSRYTPFVKPKPSWAGYSPPRAVRFDLVVTRQCLVTTKFPGSHFIPPALLPDNLSRQAFGPSA